MGVYKATILATFQILLRKILKIILLMHKTTKTWFTGSHECISCVTVHSTSINGTMGENISQTGQQISDISLVKPL